MIDPKHFRYFCGRLRRTPMLIRLLDRLGYHQERYYVKGERRERIRWVRGPRGRSIYTCRKKATHWTATLKPQGEKWVTLIHDRDFSQPGLDAAEGIENRNTPYWRSRIRKPTRTEEKVPIATEAWELGHRYQFTRWESL